MTEEQQYEQLVCGAEDRVYRAVEVLRDDTPDTTANARSIAREWFIDQEQFTRAWRGMLETVSDELGYWFTTEYEDED